jgi:hypothetical protein
LLTCKSTFSQVIVNMQKYMLTITWENVLNAEDLIYQLHLIASEKRVLLVRLYVKQCSAVVAIFDFIQTQKHPTKYSNL